MLMLGISLVRADSPAGHPLRFLALGDSYTVGEAVPRSMSWPQQLARQLSARRGVVVETDIVAATGWTTGNLLSAIERGALNDNSSSGVISPPYDLVALQIGVNNQFQGRSEVEYRQDLKTLLQRSIALAGGRGDRVFLLSIPDYAFTTFGLSLGESGASVSKAIDRFNVINSTVSRDFRVARLNVTPISRQALDDTTLLAEDGLHPSAKQYGLWVRALLAECSDRTGAFNSIAVLCNGGG